MMKVQTKDLDGSLVLQVEGRLAGPFVTELEDCWHAVRACHPDRQIALDVKYVTCVDRAGRRLLQLMHGQCVRFLGAGLATQDILEQIMEQQESK